MLKSTKLQPSHTHTHAYTSIRVSVGKAIELPDKQTVAAAAEAAQTN